MASGPADVNTMLRLGTTASQQPNEIRERRTSAEDTLAGLNADIGKPGTYDLPASMDPSAPTPGPVAPTPDAPDDLLTRDNVTFNRKEDATKYDKLIKKGYSKDQAIGLIPGAMDNAADSIFTKQKTKAEGMGTGKLGTEMTTKLDPEKAKAKIESGSQFRQVSYMMAESEQLLHRTGPLYDEMIRSTQLPIIEGAAAAARENTQNIRMAMQRGGAPRTAAFAAVQKIRSQEQINTAKGQALAEAHMNLDRWARDNAKNVINFATNWAQNQAGIRESYQSAMDHASDLMSESALPFMFATAQKAEEYRQMHSAQRRSAATKWVNFALGIVAGVATYGQNTDLLEQANDQISGKDNKIGSTPYNNAGANMGADSNAFGTNDTGEGGLLTSDLSSKSAASLFGGE